MNFSIIISNRLGKSCLAFYIEYTGCESGCQAEGMVVIINTVQLEMLAANVSNRQN